MSFVYKGDLSVNIQTHAEGRVTPFSCDICDKAFFVKKSLEKHMRIHTDEKPYSCEICQMVFTFNSELTCHRRIHTAEKSYACDICQVTYKHKNL